MNANAQLAALLNPFGLAVPTNEAALDRVLDRMVSLKERQPTNARVDQAIKALGCVMRGNAARQLAQCF